MFENVFVVRCEDLPDGTWRPTDEIEIEVRAAVALIKLGTVKSPSHPRYVVPELWLGAAGESPAEEISEEEDLDAEAEAEAPKVLKRKRK